MMLNPFGNCFWLGRKLLFPNAKLSEDEMASEEIRQILQEQQNILHNLIPNAI